jgi:hypothetical protein
VVIPEGKGGSGWSDFAQELRKFLDFFQSLHDGGNRAMQAGEALHEYLAHRMTVRTLVTVMGVSGEAALKSSYKGCWLGWGRVRQAPPLVGFYLSTMSLLHWMYKLLTVGDVIHKHILDFTLRGTIVQSVVLRV